MVVNRLDGALARTRARGLAKGGTCTQNIPRDGKQTVLGVQREQPYRLMVMDGGSWLPARLAVSYTPRRGVEAVRRKPVAQYFSPDLKGVLRTRIAADGRNPAGEIDLDVRGSAPANGSSTAIVGYSGRPVYEFHEPVSAVGGRVNGHNFS